MNAVGAPRLAQRAGFLMAGSRQYHRYEAAGTDIPQQWAHFNQGPLPANRVGTHSFGGICRSDAQGLEYMCAHEVSSYDGLDASVGRMVVPDQQYAVFSHEGPVATIKDTWQAALRWLPTSGYTDAHTPSFELYDERYDPHTRGGVIEIWIPIRPAS